jgi:hypothetical protein
MADWRLEGPYRDGNVIEMLHYEHPRTRSPAGI